MSIRIRVLAVSGAAAAALSLTAVPAFAGTPSPAPTQQTVTPTPFPHHHAAPVPWQFDLQQSDIGLIAPAVAINVNDVESGRTGIIMRNWRDVQLSPNVDRFQRGPNSVTLAHDSLFGAVLSRNLRTCTVTLDQPNGRFRIIAGTGTGANLRSFGGRFDLQAMLSFPLLRNGLCPLAFVGRFALLRFLVFNAHVGLPAPTFADVAVQGRADLLSTTPPIHIFTPTAPPSADLTPASDLPTDTPTNS